MDLSISPSSFSLCILKLLLGAYNLELLYSWLMDPFIIMKSLSLVIFLVLKSTLYDISIAMLAFFWLALS